jgi:hypothetical protein
MPEQRGTSGVADVGGGETQEANCAVQFGRKLIRRYGVYCNQFVMLRIFSRAPKFVKWQACYNLRNFERVGVRL